MSDDKYEWKENQALIASLTRGCKAVNDTVFIRRPVRKPLLEVILFEIERIFPQQHYLTILYRAVSNSVKVGIFCPFSLTAEYLHLHGDYLHIDEQFFIFRDHSPVKSSMVCTAFKKVLSNINLQGRNFDLHGFHVGHACNLLKYGYTIQEIQRIGRWKSNAVYVYLHD